MYRELEGRSRGLWCRRRSWRCTSICLRPTVRCQVCRVVDGCRTCVVSGGRGQSVARWLATVVPVTARRPRDSRESLCHQRQPEDGSTNWLWRWSSEALNTFHDAFTLVSQKKCGNQNRGASKISIRGEGAFFRLRLSNRRNGANGMLCLQFTYSWFQLSK